MLSQFDLQQEEFLGTDGQTTPTQRDSNLLDMSCFNMVEQHLVVVKLTLQQKEQQKSFKWMTRRSCCSNASRG